MLRKVSGLRGFCQPRTSKTLLCKEQRFMPEREQAKDFTADGQKYQAQRLPATTGLWIIRTLPVATEGDFIKIQRYCFLALRRYDDRGQPQPVMQADGRWIAK